MPQVFQEGSRQASNASGRESRGAGLPSQQQIHSLSQQLAKWHLPRLGVEDANMKDPVCSRCVHVAGRIPSQEGG